ncbi:MAG: PP2C family protein-serine/threonine phosphatase [bacterium]|nr:PP2C family protein-serine/threonine phosphatase [bacterium]
MSLQSAALPYFKENELELLIPVTMQDKLVSILALGKKENLQPYRSKDIELLEHVGTQIGITIDNALHHTDIVEKERLAEELKLGRQIQISLLPRTIPLVPFLSIHGIMQPAKEIGGDYYDFISLPDKKKLGIVIGDVSGKGLAAGLLMAMAKTAIHIYSSQEDSPRQTLILLNGIFNKHIGGDKFMTMLYLIWKPERSSLVYSSAGHEHILVYRDSEKKVEEIESGGIMLGVTTEIEKYIEEKEIRLNPRDKILLYTDGVTEALNPDKDRYGLEKLKISFQDHSLRPVPDLMQLIQDDLFRFMGTTPQYDDITLVVIEAG